MLFSYGSLSTQTNATQSFQSAEFDTKHRIKTEGSSRKEIKEQFEHVLKRTRSSANSSNNRDEFYAINLHDGCSYLKPGYSNNVFERVYKLISRHDNYKLIKEVTVLQMTSLSMDAKGLENVSKQILLPLRANDYGYRDAFNKDHRVTMPITEFYFGNSDLLFNNRIFHDLIVKHTSGPKVLVFN
jgi:hypothetical protein